MNYGVTGSRHGMTLQQEDLFIYIISTRAEPGFLHHGDCVGVDERAHLIASELGTLSIIHPPDEDRLRAFCDNGIPREEDPNILQPKPYLERNRDIVDQCDHLVVIPRETSERPRGGTWYTFRYARDVKKPITILWPSGSVRSYF